MYPPYFQTFFQIREGYPSSPPFLESMEWDRSNTSYRKRSRKYIYESYEPPKFIGKKRTFCMWHDQQRVPEGKRSDVDLQWRQNSRQSLDTHEESTSRRVHRFHASPRNICSFLSIKMRIFELSVPWYYSGSNIFLNCNQYCYQNRVTKSRLYQKIPFKGSTWLGESEVYIKKETLSTLSRCFQIPCSHLEISHLENMEICQQSSGFPSFYSKS